jgi:hypothetical protein
MSKVMMLSLAALVFGCSSIAQIQKGNVLVGGDISKFNIDLGTSRQFQMNIDPKVAWFIRDNMALGAYFNLGILTAKRQGTSVTYGVGGLARYYTSGADNINVVRHSRFFIEATVGINGNNPSVGDNTNGLGIGIGPGWTYFITPNIGLEALLEYQGIVGFGSSPTSSNLNLNVGFQIYLPTARLKRAVNDIERK